jgi:hypothetical protein
MLGWAARGFEGAQDADVRGLSIGFDDDTILGEAHRLAAPVIAGGGEHSQNSTFLSKLGGSLPDQSMAVPVFLRDKIAAVLYGDSGQDERITDPEVPQILALHAGLCLETLATRQKYPRPKPGERSASTPREDAAPQAAAPAPPEAASLSGVIQKPVGLTPPGGSPAVAPAVSSEPAPAVPAPAPPEAEEVTVEPAAAEAIPIEDEKVHEEAKRFARLLVSEMVLYNEKQVEEGRRNKDLYQRLKDDIDRSHHMYEQRISAEIRSSSNYFVEEMVRTLANGDESALKVPWA